MRIGLVVDAGCDLPYAFVQEHRVEILPITLHIDDQTYIDRRDPEQTSEFYRAHLANKGQAETAPFSVDEMKQIFLDRLIIDYDFVFCLTIASARSPIYDNALKASFSILSSYKITRSLANVSGPFALRVMDSQNVFAAQAVTAIETAEMIARGADANEIRERLEKLIPQVYGYLVPRDLAHLRSRAQKKGDRSVGFLKFAIGSALDIKPVIRGLRNTTTPVANLRHFDAAINQLFRFGARRIAAGLLSPHFCISYAGDLRDLEDFSAYADLKDAAARFGVKIHSGVMSMTGALTVGEGALTIAFAAPDHEFKVE